MAFSRVFVQKSFCKFYQNICGGGFFGKVLCFQHILLNSFRQMPLKYENYSLKGVFKQNSSRFLKLQKPYRKNFGLKHIENERC